jgi:signal transduction histidine kinase/CheY-like chemotaxis protein
MKIAVYDNIIERIGKRKSVSAIFFVITVLVVLLCWMIYVTYKDYRKTIVTQQQKQLLTISNSISRSIALFIQEKAENSKIIAGDPKFADIGDQIRRGSISEPVKTTLKVFMETQKNSIDSVHLLDSKGNEVFAYPSGDKISQTGIDGTREPGVDRVLVTGNQYISDACKDETDIFFINIYTPIIHGNEFQGILVSVVKLDTIYNQIVSQVRAGEKGYAMVKDMNGSILMHPIEEQRGIDVIKTRKERYPNLDLSDLEELVRRQMTGVEGTAVYDSYWWQDEVLVKAKKISGFAPVYISDYFWVVAVTMSYDEVVEPIRETLYRTIMIALVIVVLFSIIVFLAVRIQKNKEALEIETKYLRELNNASEELRRRDIQLQHSEKLKTIGLLTGGIAHEFNNLLTPILGYSELLMSKLSEKDELYEDVAEIYDSSVKAKELIEQILILSRNDNGVSKFQAICINDLLKETLKLAKSVLPTNINVVENINCDCSYIFANKAQIHQVIFNLCTNAYHAMKHSGGTLEITVDTVEADKEKALKDSGIYEGEYVRITVKDTGCGMSEETISKIFDPFFTTKPAGEGTGLGLFIVQGIIDKHKGAITVESKLGEGSCFNVYLPKMKEKPSIEVNEKDKLIYGEGTILLVDDKQKVVNMLKKELEYFGFNVVADTSSIGALKIFEESPKKFDLVITDMTMPYLTGVELAERLKQIRQDIKIILITGFLDETVLGYKDKQIIDDYMVKPIFSAKLGKMIGDVLSSG